MSRIQFVMTIIGPDRTGLVELLAGRVAEQGGNWLESRMAHLGGQFAGILRIEAPAENQEAFLEGLKNLESQGLTIVAQTGQVAPESRPELAAELEMVSHDQPGIVRQISRVLTRFGVNVEELNTACVSAPMSGETLFKARAKLRLPPACPIPELRAELEKIAQGLMADFTLAECGVAGATDSVLETSGARRTTP